MIKRTKLNNLEERKKCLANLRAGDYGVFRNSVRRLEEIAFEEEYIKERKEELLEQCLPLIALAVWVIVLIMI